MTPDRMSSECPSMYVLLLLYYYLYTSDLPTASATAVWRDLIHIVHAHNMHLIYYYSTDKYYYY